MKEKEEIYSLIKNFINDPLVIELTNYYNSLSFMEILNVTRNEKVHSSFLAWLFNANKNFYLGTLPLNLLLDLLIKVDCNNIPKSINIPDIIIRKAKITIPSVATEYSLSDNSGYADIRIRFNIDDKQYGIVIENKVKSTENENKEKGIWQTDKYYEHFNKEKNIEYIYVFLAPDHQKKKAIAHCPHFINISYTEIVNEVIMPILADKSLNEQTKLILNDYLKILNKPNIENQKDSALVLAVSAYEENILKQIRDNHKILGDLLLNSEDFLWDDFINVRPVIISAVWPDALKKKNKNRTFAELNIPIGSILYLAKSAKSNEINNKDLFVTTIDNLNQVEYIKDGKIITKTITAAAQDLSSITYNLNGFQWFIYNEINLYNYKRK